MRVFNLFVFWSLVALAAFGQDPKSVLLRRDSVTFVSPAWYAEVPRGSDVSFESTDTARFRPFTFSEAYTRRPVWWKFYLRPADSARRLVFLPPLADRIELYVPVSGGYERLEAGRLSRVPVRHDILESTLLSVPAKKPDYSRPFYLFVRNLTSPEPVPLRPGKVSLSRTDRPMRYEILQSGQTRKYQIYLGILGLAFFLFLISYRITGDRNFFNYSLYLLALVAVFVHQIPFLHNALSNLNPPLPGIVGRLGIIAAALAYFRFLVGLLETPRYAPRLNRLIGVVWVAALMYAAWKAVQMFVWPDFPYDYELYVWFHALFMAVGLFIFSVMWFRPVPPIKKIIILGSYLLVAGHLMSMVSRSDFPFLNMVLAEIVLFFTIILLHYKRVHEERVQYKLHLLAEQQKRENLQALSEMKSQFFSHVSHEFRTPLTLIHALLNRLEKERPELVETYVRPVRRHARRLLELVDQLLDLTRLQSKTLEPNLRTARPLALIRMWCEGFRPVAKEKEINFVVRVPDEEIIAKVDSDFLQKIWTNLLSNAFKYTPRGGTVICDAVAEKGRLVFEIKNTGEGLSAEELERVFDRFYQKNPGSEGAGLGLSLVKELVKTLGGRIEARSEAGGWTVFRVELPLELPRGEPLSTEGDSLEEPETEQRSGKEEVPLILVIEDHPEMRSYVAGLLEDEFKVLAAADGEEGVRLARETVPDLVISDIMMPGMDGYAVCRTLQNDFRTSHIPVILLTAKGSREDKRRGTGCGAVDYIVKPFDEEVLKSKVRNWMRTLENQRRRHSREVLLEDSVRDIGDPEKTFWKKLDQLLARKLSDPHFGVENLANELGVNRMQLHRKLKALTGLSVSEFLRARRLRAAARLLETTRWTVNEVAYAAGFNTPSYFVRRFKEAFGLTPGEYREKVKAERKPSLRFKRKK
ncbi:MAG: response regulator [Chlorobi bacterium]|nr:response regulator [Chlorobiota bacterium]